MKQMRVKYFYLLALLILNILLICSCKSKGRSEAEQEAQVWFEKSFANCEGVIVSRYNSGGELRELNIGSQLGNRVDKGFLEFKELSFQVEEGKPTEADRLNRIEWVGTLNLLPKKSTVRYYKLQEPNARWSEWKSDLIIYAPSYSPIAQLAKEFKNDVNDVTPMVKVVTKKAGQWSGFPEGFSAPQCSDVPK